jgi:methanogenic corrinoid protein MtbC1
MSLEERRSEFLDALRLGHENRCGQLIHGLIDTGRSRSAAADLLITNAMHQFGHMWEQGDLAIYQERRACGICLGLLHDLKQQAVPRANGPVAIGGTLSNDTYQLPSQLVELTLCDLGWRATSLGCNLPMHSFKAAVLEYRPKLLWFSLSIVHSEEDFVREFNELADSICDSTAIIIGGRAANDSLRPRLRYTAHCDSLTHLAELADKLVDR